MFAENALPASVPLGGAEQVRTKPLDQHRGVGATGVAVAAAELLHACLTDASGLLGRGVVGHEVEGDVAVQAGEQVQRRGVVGLQHRP